MEAEIKVLSDAEAEELEAARQRALGEDAHQGDAGDDQVSSDDTPAVVAFERFLLAFRAAVDTFTDAYFVR